MKNKHTKKNHRRDWVWAILKPKHGDLGSLVTHRLCPPHFSRAIKMPDDDDASPPPRLKNKHTIEIQFRRSWQHISAAKHKASAIPLQNLYPNLPRSCLAILSSPPQVLPGTREAEEQANVCRDQGQHRRCSKHISELA